MRLSIPYTSPLFFLDSNIIGIRYILVFSCPSPEIFFCYFILLSFFWIDSHSYVYFQLTWLFLISRLSENFLLRSINDGGDASFFLPREYPRLMYAQCSGLACDMTSTTLCGIVIFSVITFFKNVQCLCFVSQLLFVSRTLQVYAYCVENVLVFSSSAMRTLSQS